MAAKNKPSSSESVAAEWSRCPSCAGTEVETILTYRAAQTVEIGKCHNCGATVIRVGGVTVYPAGAITDAPCATMPPDIRDAYMHAASVAHVAPGAACAIMAPALEKMCDSLGAKGSTLADKIAFLRNEGRIPPEMAQAAEAVATPVDTELAEEDARKRAYDLLRFSNYMGGSLYKYGP
jgi:hypothetical protein